MSLSVTVSNGSLLACPVPRPSCARAATITAPVGPWAVPHFKPKSRQSLFAFPKFETSFPFLARPAMSHSGVGHMAKEEALLLDEAVLQSAYNQFQQTHRVLSPGTSSFSQAGPTTPNQRSMPTFGSCVRRGGVGLRSVGRDCLVDQPFCNVPPPPAPPSRARTLNGNTPHVIIAFALSRLPPCISFPVFSAHPPPHVQLNLPDHNSVGLRPQKQFTEKVILEWTHLLAVRPNQHP